jgi:nitroreductase
MELDDVIRRRRMVRRYDPDRQVPEDIVTRLLEYAVHAPSAGFTQGWDFVVLRAAADRTAFWAATTEPDSAPDSWLSGLLTAPTLVVCCSSKTAYLDRYAEPDKGVTDRDEGFWPVPYWDVDTGMAALLILLGAVDAGLGGCFFGIPVGAHDRVRAALGSPDERRLVGVVSLGYRRPDERSPSLRRGRKPLTDVVHWGRFGAAPPPPAPPL